MNAPVTWILGKGGMVGSRLAQLMQRYPETGILWNPSHPWVWHTLSQAEKAFAENLHMFYRTLPTDGQWRMIWVAGSGTVGSSAAELAHESQLLQSFLSVLKQVFHCDPRRGTVFFASSGGTVYGNNTELLTEESATGPISLYGQEKLVQERLLQDWQRTMPQVSVLVGRLSNIYGEQQHMRKFQGLISHLSRAIIHCQPIHIYVSLDTIRDYLYVGDAAEGILACLLRLEQQHDPCFMIKIIASEQITTIAELIALFQKVIKKRARIIPSSREQSDKHVSAVRFKSVVWPDIAPQRNTSLPVGIHRIHQYNLHLHALGKLPPLTQER